MSVLAWMFGLGLLAAAFPLLFHLIRRTPKGQVKFSSLMFLRPSPPSLTRRSRLENLMLLAIRIGAIALIAAAFMRPFFRDNVNLTMDDLPGQKIAIMLDTSASMKRGDLWPQAIDRASKIIEKTSQKDEVAVYTFDSQLQMRKSFGRKLSGGDFRSQYQLVDVEPTWSPSDLGGCLIRLANELEQADDEISEDSQSEAGSSTNTKLQMLVVSDMQAGSSITALQNYQWPDRIKVDFEQVSLKDQSNASVELLPADESDPNSIRENVLVRNATDSSGEEFKVVWANETLSATDKPDKETIRPVTFYVPPGMSKILPVPRGTTSEAIQSDNLVLTGDDFTFDNQYFTVPPIQEKLSVVYLGNESADDPNEMLFYLQRAMMETPTRSISVLPFTGAARFSTSDGIAPELIVITRAVDAAEQNAVDSLLENGATLLVVLSDESTIESTTKWTGVDSSANFTAEADQDDYAMLGQIKYSHPIFQPFAGPRFNDFTQIRFWKTLEVKTLPDSFEAIAKFENDSPAVWHREFPESKSHVYVMATGWQPEVSQLALSSKFLPLMNRILELAVRTPQVVDSCTIDGPIQIPTGYDLVSFAGNSPTEIDPELSLKSQITIPGIYEFSSSTDATQPRIRIAANVNSSESNTDTMPLDQITAFDVQVGMHSEAETEIANQRKLRDLDFESRQKLWKWLIIGAIALVIAESWLAGRTDRIGLTAEKDATRLPDASLMDDAA
jgi:hypothetical protein